MDFLELAQSRRSIRSFTKRAVSQEDILKLLKAAQAAPSGGNCQPWHFFVIHDESVKEDIANATGGNKSFISTTPIMIVVCANIPKSEERYGERGRDLYCIQDTAAAIQNILLCAKSLGLGTCWCGAFDENIVSKVLCLPPKMRPIAIIPVGYPANEPLVSTSRKDLDKIVTFIGESNGYSEGEEKEQRRIEHCDMGSTAFEDINLGCSSFNNINFSGVEITDANLTDGKIHECNLTNFAIYDCNLDGLTINGKNIGDLLKD